MLLIKLDRTRASMKHRLKHSQDKYALHVYLPNNVTYSRSKTKPKKAEHQLQLLTNSSTPYSVFWEGYMRRWKARYLFLEVLKDSNPTDGGDKERKEGKKINVEPRNQLPYIWSIVYTGFKEVDGVAMAYCSELLTVVSYLSVLHSSV